MSSIQRLWNEDIRAPIIDLWDHNHFSMVDGNNHFSMDDSDFSMADLVCSSTSADNDGSHNSYGIGNKDRYHTTDK